MVKKSNGWNLQEMQDTLVKDTEQKIEQGFKDIANGQQAGGAPSGTTTAPSGSAASVEPEPTKGVQTYIPMSMYRRLNDIKLTRGENIAALVAQAIAFWLDAQEGKRAI